MYPATIILAQVHRAHRLSSNRALPVKLRVSRSYMRPLTTTRVCLLLILLLVCGCLVSTTNAVRFDASRTSLLKIRTNGSASNPPLRDVEPPLHSCGTDSSTLLALRGGDFSTTTTAAVGVVPTVEEVLHAIDLFGTAVFAFGGAVIAGKKGMDLLGVIMVATVTALGGGTVRDLLLGSGTVFWLVQPLFFEISILAAMATFFCWPTLEQKMGVTDSDRIICLADAFALGAFSVLGTQKAANRNLRPIMWVLSGLVSCTFGGITRDVFCRQPPRVMYPQKSLYGTPPLLGSIVYTLLTYKCNVAVAPASIATFFVTFVTRVLAFDSPLRLPHWNCSPLPDKLHPDR